jgi:hypothetical protein
MGDGVASERQVRGKDHSDYQSNLQPREIEDSDPPFIFLQKRKHGGQYHENTERDQ